MEFDKHFAEKAEYSEPQKAIEKPPEEPEAKGEFPLAPESELEEPGGTSRGAS